jgi:hypothetical protein
MNNHKAELRLADGTPVRIVGEWTPVKSYGPRAKWDHVETDVYVDEGTTFTNDDLTRLIDTVNDHYTSGEVYCYVDKHRYWQLQYLAQGKRYPSPRKRKSPMRMSKKWRNRA